MNSTLNDFIAIGPISIVSFTALLVLTIEALKKKTEDLNCWISVIGLAAALVLAYATLGEKGTAFHDMVRVGGYGHYFAIMFCLAGALTLMLSRSYIKKEGIEHGEYYSLLLFAVAGMMLMAAAADLIIVFLGLELMSIAFYVMAGFARRRATSNEAALKYFLLGAFATGFLLYGIALVYGSAHTTNITAMIAAAADTRSDTIFIIGLGMLLIGLAFKIAAVPFHMWVPDVYEGSPTTVTGFMSTGGKAAAFSALLLVFAPGLLSVLAPVREVLAVIAVLSMVVGNVIAISQSSIKRMLAYSSIAHAGYILVGIVAGNMYGSNGVLFYLVAYTVMNVGAFGVLSLLESTDGGSVSFDAYAGLSTKQPMLAALMSVFMFSLSGIPPFAGFFGKYYVFAGAVAAGYTWLAIAGVIMSVVSAYYYLRVVVMMYFRQQESPLAVPDSKLGYGALLISALGVIILGIFPSFIINLTSLFL